MAASIVRGGVLSLAFAASATVASAADAPASGAAPAPEARIAFAKSNIWNWQVVNDETVLIQDVGRRWYKAALFGHCINLPFAQRIGFDSNLDGTFDKFSAIQIRGQRCPLRSLVETAAPPKKSKGKQPAPAPAAAPAPAPSPAAAPAAQ